MKARCNGKVGERQQVGVFRVVDKTDGRNLLAIVGEIDSNREESSGKVNVQASRKVSVLT